MTLTLPSREIRTGRFSGSLEKWPPKYATDSISPGLCSLFVRTAANRGSGIVCCRALCALGGRQFWGALCGTFLGYEDLDGLLSEIDLWLFLKHQRIFSTLTRYDRLNLPRLKFHSGLSNRQLLPALAAMIQQHLVYHYTSYDDGVTYYEANLQSAYYLVRAGKILEFVEERLGKYAATVMSSIMYLGHAQVSHLENLPELQPEQSHTNGVDKEHDEVDGDEEQPNGLSGDHSDQQPALLHPTLKVLAAHGYIIRVREAQFQSHADNILDAERVLKSRPEIKAMKGKRMEEAVIEGTLELLKERTDGDLTRGLMVQGVPRGAKRKHGSKSADAPNKKARVDFASVDEDDEQDEEENEWSDDEMGYDTTPMEVSSSITRYKRRGMKS